MNTVDQQLPLWSLTGERKIMNVLLSKLYIMLEGDMYYEGKKVKQGKSNCSHI